jgi:hypothetical protein
MATSSPAGGNSQPFHEIRARGGRAYKRRPQHAPRPKPHANPFYGSGQNCQRDGTPWRHVSTGLSDHRPDAPGPKAGHDGSTRSRHTRRSSGGRREHGDGRGAGAQTEGVEIQMSARPYIPDWKAALEKARKTPRCGARRRKGRGPCHQPAMKGSAFADCTGAKAAALRARLTALTGPADIRRKR